MIWRAVGAKQRMGELIRRGAVNLVLGWIGFGLGVVVLLGWAGLTLAFLRDQAAGDPARTGMWVGLIVLGVTLLPLGLLITWRGWRARQLRIDVHAGGVAYADGLDREAVPWDDVQSLFFDRYPAVRLTIQAPFKPPIVIDGRFPDHTALAEAAHQLAVQAMQPRLEAALHAGQRVVFGPLALDGWGVHVGHGAYPWDAVGALRWEARGTSMCCALYGADGALLAELDPRIPNRTVLERLLTQMGKVTS